MSAPRICYVIASYSGADHTSNLSFAADVLHVQMMQFVRTLEDKRARSIPNLITAVVIVCPQPRGPVLDGYYRWAEWRASTAPFGVSVMQLPYVGKNEHYSYDQWLQAYVAYPDYDYYLLNEDDYYLAAAESDVRLVDAYRRAFPDGVGYLCQYRIDDECYGPHAATSNGLISRRSFERVASPPADVLDKFYTLMYWGAQVRFSHVFLGAGVDIRDIRDQYTVLHWASNLQYAIDFTRPACAGTPSIFLPVQIVLDADVDVRKATSNHS